MDAIVYYDILVFNETGATSLKRYSKRFTNIIFEFREICVASGTDYNPNKKTSLYKTLKYFNRFQKTRKIFMNG